MREDQKTRIELSVLQQRRELPVHPEESAAPDELSRRTMLKLMGASAALALGVTGCERKPARQIVARADGPEFQVPGKSVYYASTWTEGNVPYGMLVKTVDGRPIKIEGLPEHVLNRGTASAQMQASVLGLYDPDRLQKVVKAADLAAVDAKLIQSIKNGSKPVVVLTRAHLGPSERALIQDFLAAIPGKRGRHYVYESVHDTPRRMSMKTLFGVDGEWTPNLKYAKIILSLDCDFLGTDGAALTNIREFAATRRVRSATDSMSRMYVAESALSVTGSNADHRIKIRPSQALDLARALLAWLKGDKQALVDFAQTVDEAKVLASLAVYLKENRGHAVVMAGGHHAAAVHAAVALLNKELDAYTKTLTWNPNPATLVVSDPGLIEKTLAAGVDALITLGVNPVYDWSGGISAKTSFADLMKKATVSVAHSLRYDETVEAASYGIPSAHNLESWNDSAVSPSMTGLCQPVIRPLYDAARQEAESLFVWTKLLAPTAKNVAACRDWHDYLKQRWTRGVLPQPTIDEGKGKPPGWPQKKRWHDALRLGFHFSPLAAKAPEFKTPLAEMFSKAGAAAQAGQGGASQKTLEVIVQPHHAIGDGRFANNGWLQELPDPVNKLTWENAVSLSPATAKLFGVGSGDVLQLSAETGKVDVPVIVQTGMADGVAVTTLGHGHTVGGVIATQEGVSVVPLLVSGGGRIVMNVGARNTGKKAMLARTQEAFSQVDPIIKQVYPEAKENPKRPIALVGTLGEYRAAVSSGDKQTPPATAAHGQEDSHAPAVKGEHGGGDTRSKFIQKKYGHIPAAANIYPPMAEAEASEYKWAMAIDLSTCVGCSACVTACQAENNIPIVGKTEVAKGREMHWMRIDRYEDEDGTSHNQPMLCQQCDNAPCENVCPVNATAHSPDGLNEMVYNRCVGTRYCGNNCPYKVRRFNFLEYTGKQLAHQNPVQQLVFNPQVTVRSRGVMEKCSFCVQRITAAKFTAKNENRKVKDGEIQTACQQSCPAGSITFGNVKEEPASKVSQEISQLTSYHVLEETTVKPNVNYLVKIKNPGVTPSGSGTAKHSAGGGQHG